MNDSNTHRDAGSSSQQSARSNLLHLPAEVRSIVYDFLLHHSEPGLVSILWRSFPDKLWSRPVAGVSKSGEERWRPIKSRVQDATALMRTCSTVWREVAPRLYAGDVFLFTTFNGFKLFPARLTPPCRSMVESIELRRETMDIIPIEHAQRLADSVAAFPGLRCLALENNFREADTIVDGSAWRYRSIRDMRAIQRSCPRLSRTYHTRLRWGQDLWNVRVIFKTAAAGPQHDEIEFSVDEEYGKILQARRRQGVMYEEDVLDGWELVEDIAARNDVDSEVDAMEID